mgnify:CR=1 FL=1
MNELLKILFVDVLGASWIVATGNPDEKKNPSHCEGELGFRIMGQNFFYYKDAAPHMAGYYWRRVKSREFGEVIRPAIVSFGMNLKNKIFN